MVKAKVVAAMIVMRLKFFSATVEPAAVEPTEPPNMSETPPPLPECNSTRATIAMAETMCRVAMIHVSMSTKRNSPKAVSGAWRQIVTNRSAQGFQRSLRYIQVGVRPSGGR